MSWAKFDDRYDDNPKVKAVWRSNRAAVGLHAMAITYSSRHETDGLIDRVWLEERLPGKKEREKTLDALVMVGLFEPVGDGRFLVHDYLDFNPSSEQLQDRRRRDSERKRKQSPNGIHADSNGIPNGSGADSARIPDDPSRTPAGAGSGREKKR